MNDRTPMSVPEETLTLLENLTDAFSVGADLSDLAVTVIQGCLDHGIADEAGFLIADQHRRLQLIAHTTETTRHLELSELQAESGPCVEAFKTGNQVACRDLRSNRHKWPEFVDAALAAGVTQAYSIPVRLRNQTVGALNLFRTGDEPIHDEGIRLAEVFAGTASVGIIARHELGAQQNIAKQLQTALDSRVVVEQAKGVVAAKTGMSVHEAFTVLRSQARHERRTLTEVAHDIVAGSPVDVPERRPRSLPVDPNRGR